MNEQLDPLDEREANNAEVARKRLLESMEDDAQLEQLRVLLQNENVRDLLWRLVGWCGIFTDPMNANFGNVAYGLGKAAIGKKLIVEINLADPQAWLAMQLKAAEVTAAQARADALRKLRKGRSPSTSL